MDRVVENPSTPPQMDQIMVQERCKDPPLFLIPFVAFNTSGQRY